MTDFENDSIQMPEQPAELSATDIYEQRTLHTRHQAGLKRLQTVLLITGGLLLLCLIYAITNIVLAKEHLKSREFTAADRCYSNILVSKLLFKQEAAYAAAGTMLEGGQYLEAVNAFGAFDNYLDAEELAKESTYKLAEQKEAGLLYDEAIDLFGSLKDYRDAGQRVLDTYKKKGLALVEAGQFKQALDTFNVLLEQHYAGAETLISMTNFEYGRQLLADGDYYMAYVRLTDAGNYTGAPEARDAAAVLVYDRSVKLYRNASYASARAGFSLINGYKNSADYLVLIKVCKRLNSELDAEALRGIIFDELMPIITLENAGEMALYNLYFSDVFMKGTWRGDTKELKVRDEGATTDLPIPDKADKYFVVNGEWTATGEGMEDTAVWKVTILSQDVISIYVYSNEKTYTLYRQ